MSKQYIIDEKFKIFFLVKNEKIRSKDYIIIPNTRNFSTFYFPSFVQVLGGDVICENIWHIVEEVLVYFSSSTSNLILCLTREKGRKKKKNVWMIIIICLLLFLLPSFLFSYFFSTYSCLFLLSV